MVDLAVLLVGIEMGRDEVPVANRVKHVRVADRVKLQADLVIELPTRSRRHGEVHFGGSVLANGQEVGIDVARDIVLASWKCLSLGDKVIGNVNCRGVGGECGLF